MGILNGPIDGAAILTRDRLRASARSLCGALACIAGFSASHSAPARDYSLRDVGEWTVAPSKDGSGCFLTRDYAGNSGTTLLFGLDIDGTNHVSVLNANWSIKPKDRLKLNFRLSNSSYPAHFAVGMASAGKRGFVTSFGTKFPSYFAGSKTFNITRGTVPVERLSLDGVEAAMTELRKCVAAQRPKPAGTAARKNRSDDIPSDPFAAAPARESKK